MINSVASDTITSDNSPYVTSKSILMLVTGLFFLSGSAGLVYQVLWMRSLGLFFGGDMYGVAIILGTCMGGLALGSLLGDRLGEFTARPLTWYGIPKNTDGYPYLEYFVPGDLFSTSQSIMCANWSSTRPTRHVSLPTSPPNPCQSYAP